MKKEQTKSKHFGEKLRALRQQHQLTLKELALELGLSAHGYISELESGRKIPTVELVKKVASLFSVTTDELLTDEVPRVKAAEKVSKGVTRKKATAAVPLAERPPTASEVERLRLLLSTYQDGTGMLQVETGLTLPGWRDFERAVALAFNGEAQESKAIFDVLLHSKSGAKRRYGISCKMRRELDRVARDGRVTIELSNSAGQFWAYLKTKGINQSNYQSHPAKVGTALIELVESWHQMVSLANGGVVDLSRSCYLVLSWNRKRWYQLHQFPLLLPRPQTLTWHFPQNRTGEVGRRLTGADSQGIILEWYGESGGQLKYYPPASAANWQSSLFELELLQDASYGILNKAAAYFPKQWAKACGEALV